MRVPYHTLQETSRSREQHLSNANPRSGITIFRCEISLEDPDPLT
jgi:hypothetical protein